MRCKRSGPEKHRAALFRFFGFSGVGMRFQPAQDADKRLLRAEEIVPRFAGQTFQESCAGVFLPRDRTAAAFAAHRGRGRRRFLRVGVKQNPGFTHFFQTQKCVFLIAGKGVVFGQCLVRRHEMMRIIVGILLAVHGVYDIRNLVQKPILLVCAEPVRRGEEGKALGKAVGAECRIPMQKRGVRLLLI